MSICTSRQFNCIVALFDNNFLEYSKSIFVYFQFQTHYTEEVMIFPVPVCFYSWVIKLDD